MLSRLKTLTPKPGDLKISKLSSTHAALMFGVGFVLYSALYILGEYQNHNGDFGQYYIHGQNLIKGRPWGHLVEGYPAVLPGYPIILAICSIVFGDSLFAIGLVNSVLWATLCVLAFVYFRPRFAHPITALACLFATLFSSYVLVFQQDGQPNITYTFIFTAAMVAAHQIAHGKRVILCICLILLASMVRLESLTIYIAIALYWTFNKHYKRLWIPALGVVLTLGMDAFLDIRYGMKSNIIHLLNTSDIDGTAQSRSIWAFFTQYFYFVISYLLSIPKLLTASSLDTGNAIIIEAANGLKTQFGLLHVVILGLFLKSFLSVQTLWQTDRQSQSFLSLDRLFFMGHIAIISLFFLKTLPVRYLIPVFPIFMVYVFLSLETLATRIRIKPVFAAILIFLASGIMSMRITPEVGVVPKRKNYLTTPELIEVVDHLATFNGDRDVGFWKPRLLTVLLDDRNAAVNRTQGVRRPIQAERLFDTNGILVQFRHFMRDELANYLENSDHICVTWESRGYMIYERKDAGRPCLAASD